MRYSWKSSLSFGLVSILAKLYSAVQTSSLDFDMIDAVTLPVASATSGK